MTEKAANTGDDRRRRHPCWRFPLMDIAASYTQPDQLVGTVKRMALPGQGRRLGASPSEGRRGFVPANAVVAPGVFSREKGARTLTKRHLLLWRPSSAELR